jgi:hypothetical protein
MPKQTPVKQYWVITIAGDQLAPGLNQESLNQINVDLLDSRLPRFLCRSCEKEWTPAVKEYHIPAFKKYGTEARIDRELPVGWWRCPSGCSAKAARRLFRQLAKPRKAQA